MEGKIKSLYNSNSNEFKITLIRTSIEIIDDLEAIVEKDDDEKNIERCNLFNFDSNYLKQIFGEGEITENEFSEKELYFLKRTNSSLSDYNLALSVLTFLDVLEIKASILIAGFIYFDRFVKKFQKRIKREIVKK